MRKLLRRAALAALVALALPTLASAYIEYQTDSGTLHNVTAMVMMWVNGSGVAQPTSATNPLPVAGTLTAVVPVSDYQGTMTLPAATVVPLTAASVTAYGTMAPGSGPLPNGTTAWGNLLIINSGSSQPGDICWFNSTNAAGAGCEILPANGGNDAKNLTGVTVTGGAPSFYSPGGTTISFGN